MKTSSFQFNRPFLLVVVVTLPFLAALMFFLISRRLKTDQSDALEWARHSRLVVEQVQSLERSIDQLEQTDREYLLTASEADRLKFYLKATAVLEEYEELRLLLIQQNHWEFDLKIFEEQIKNRIAFLRQIAQLKESGQSGEAVDDISSDRSRSDLESLHSSFATMLNSESKALNRQRELVETRSNIREVITLVLLALSTAVVVGAGILFLRIKQLQNIITVCAWTQRVNYNGRWMRMEEFLWERFRVKVSHGISEEAFDGVMGIVGKNLTISDDRVERPTTPVSTKHTNA
jgi:CHASE3 domain sensor protein